MRRRPVPLSYFGLSAADVLLAARGANRARGLTKPGLMPVLAVSLMRSSSPRDQRRLIEAGLWLSAAGDVALLGDGDTSFAAGLTSFLAAHLCYLLAWRHQRRGGIRRAAWAAGAYVLAWVALNVVLWPRTGKLRIPVLIYGTALAAMALTALDTGDRKLALGGAAFLVSDSVLAANTFVGTNSSWADAIVMLTYTAAQGLITAGTHHGRDPAG